MEEALTDVVEERGGHIMPLNYQGLVNYCLLTSEGQCHPKAEEMVSHFFLEDCITAKVRVIVFSLASRTVLATLHIIIIVIIRFVLVIDSVLQYLQSFGPQN